MKIVAVIPTLYRPPTLQPLLDVLQGDDVEVVLIDTTGRPPAIYQWWNEGADEARDMGATEIAILNDDIIIVPGTMPALARALRSDENVGLVCPSMGKAVVRSSISLAPVKECVSPRTFCCFPGWNFMYKADLPLPRFDEGFQWYGGDDAFANEVVMAGYSVMGVKGVVSDHIGSWSDRKKTAEEGRIAYFEEKKRDRQHWAEYKRLCPGWPAGVIFDRPRVRHPRNWHPTEVKLF